jgi:hypothetical protein
MSVQGKLVGVLWKWVAPLAGVAALGLAVYLYVHSPAPSNYQLRITAGNALGMRHQLALRLQGEVARRNPAFELVPSAGSEEALYECARGELTGKEFLSGFLGQVNEVRDCLARLILQQAGRPLESRTATVGVPGFGRPQLGGG